MDDGWGTTLCHGQGRTVNPEVQPWDGVGLELAGSTKQGLELNSVDTRILEELRLDGRQPASGFAKRLGISRTYACERLEKILAAKVARVGAFTNALALGYNVLALTAVRVEPGQLSAVADRLSAFPNMVVVIVGVGWRDILTWSLFLDQSDLYAFTSGELSNVAGIRSAETLTVVEAYNAAPYLHARYQNAGSSPVADLRDSRPSPRGSTAQRPAVDAPCVDAIDLQILSEIERDGRQPVQEIAKKLGISRTTASAKLKRLLEEEVARIVTIVGPVGRRNYVFAETALKVSPREVNSVVQRLKDLPQVSWLARVVGGYDVIVGTTAMGSAALLQFMEGQVFRLPGLVSVETMVGLEVRKTSYEYLATAHLQRLRQRGR